MREHWQLPRRISREAVLADRGRLEVLGGLASGDVTIAAVTAIDPSDGVAVAAGRLGHATHDAGAAIVAGHAVVIGGGATTSRDWIQQRAAAGRWATVGRLPGPRSDLVAVALGGSGYVIGGYDGTTTLPSVLRLSRAGTVEVAGRLAVPVRYPAAAAADGAVWIAGGRAAAGPTDVVQRFDVSTGRTRVVAHLPAPVEGASAVVLGGAVYVCGGVVGGAPTARILRIDPATGRVTRAGRLPRPLSYSGAAVLGATAYLVGGEDPAPTAAVVRLRLVRRAPSTKGTP